MNAGGYSQPPPGAAADSAGAFLSSVERFDPREGRWEPAAPLLEARMSAGVRRPPASSPFLSLSLSPSVGNKHTAAAAADQQ